MVSHVRPTDLACVSFGLVLVARMSEIWANGLKHPDLRTRNPTNPTTSSTANKNSRNAKNGGLFSLLGFVICSRSLCSAMSLLKFKAFSQTSNRTDNGEENGENEKAKERKRMELDLGDGSEIIYVPRCFGSDESWVFFDYLNTHIPWTRPTIRVFGRSCVQPRDTCYVASPGLPELVYSGYKPHAYSWDDYPPLKDIVDVVHKALPGSRFNSLLLNRYKGGNDNVGWHADDEKLYGPTPEIASVSFGCERDFLMKKRPAKSKVSLFERRTDDEPANKRLKKTNLVDQHSFTLKHGSLLVMRGNTQRDWLHSVPKRAKADATRINLTFRHVV